MCAIRKRFVNACAFVFVALSPALAAESAGGIALGEGEAGITDRAYVMAPPHYLYVVEKEPGSFLDCGAGLETRLTDASGRDLAALICGVSLTETVIIPAASASARIVIHY